MPSRTSFTQSSIGRSGSAKPGVSNIYMIGFFAFPRAKFFKEVTCLVSPPPVLFEALNLLESFPSSRKLQMVDFPTPGPPRGTITKGAFYIESIVFKIYFEIVIVGKEIRCLFPFLSIMFDKISLFSVAKSLKQFSQRSKSQFLIHLKPFFKLKLQRSHVMSFNGFL